MCGRALACALMICLACALAILLACALMIFLLMPFGCQPPVPWGTVTCQFQTCTSCLVQKCLHYCWGQWCFALLMQKHVELLRQDGFDLRVEKSCLSSLTGILLCCMCNLSCEFFTQKFCQRHLNLVVEMLVITTLIGVQMMMNPSHIY